MAAATYADNCRVQKSWWPEAIMPEAIITFTSTSITVATSSSVTSSTSLHHFHHHRPRLFFITDAAPFSDNTSDGAANPCSLPLSATVFMPEITAVSCLPVADPFLLPYHVVPQRLTFVDLCLYKNNSRLPTSLPGKFIVGNEDLVEVVEVEVGGGAVEVEVDLVGDGC